MIGAVATHLALEAEIGGYEAAAEAAAAIDGVYDGLATLVGASARNIAVASSATTAYSQALSSFAFAAGDVILTSRADYVSNQLMFVSLAQRTGVQVVEAEEAPEGGVDPGSVRDVVRRVRPKLVAITWVPTFSGLIQPVEEVGAVCADADIPYLVDGCQAVGQLPVDVRALRCDFLAATARKFLRGPRGIGFLYVSDAAVARGAYPLFVDMRGADWVGARELRLADGARRFEQWEMPHALVLGMGAAARYALEVGVEQSGVRARTLAAAARTALAGVDGVRVLDRGRRLAALATVDCGRDAGAIVAALRARRINTSAQSRDETFLPLERLGVRSLLRVSPHYYNTEAEIAELVAALSALLRNPVARGKTAG